MAKIRIHVLTMYNSPNSLALTYPLLIHRQFFNKHGVKIYFYDRIDSKIYNCDILFINSKFFRMWHVKKMQELYYVLAGFKKRLQKVIWFDTADSTGTTQFNVMPFVDGYYKSQVLKDRSLYFRPFYGYRIFTDYYKNQFGLEDEKEANSDEIGKQESVGMLLQKEHAHKLRISWNSAMNEWGNYNYLYGGIIAKIKGHLPFRADYRVSFTDPDREREVDILGRIGLSHTRNTVRYQREQIVKKLKEKFNLDASVIQRGQYLDEMKNSKIGISPFGLGEISCRDFEIIINGALLFKQDMSHLETWPPLYVDNETYVPFSWDLKDFEERLKGLLGDEKRIARISKRAQELYAYYIYGKGRMQFCDKVMNIIGQKDSAG